MALNMFTNFNASMNVISRKVINLVNIITLC